MGRSDKEPVEIVTENAAALIKPSLSELVRRRAGDALMKVVGAYLPDVLAKAQASKDDRDAKSAFRKGLVEAATRKAAQNPQLVNRMLDRLVEEEFAKQERREIIARKALEHFDDETEPPSEEDEFVDPDWINLYNSFSERASSEALQDMWSRVLSGEIRRPGSISLQTLQFVSVLDMDTAAAASRLLPWLINGVHLYSEVAKAIPLEDLILLRDVGLIGSLTPDLSSTFTIGEDGLAALAFAGRIIVMVKGTPGSKIAIQSISVSRTCRELAKVVPIEDPGDAIAALTGEMRTNSLVAAYDVGPFSYLPDGRINQPYASMTDRWQRSAGG